MCTRVDVGARKTKATIHAYEMPSLQHAYAGTQLHGDVRRCRRAVPCSLRKRLSLARSHADHDAASTRVAVHLHNITIDSIGLVWHVPGTGAPALLELAT